MPSGANHHGWKGDDASYKSIHGWVSRQFGKPRKCECCNSETAPLYDWANVSGEYRRDRGDWVRLCRKCHSKYDRDQRSTLFYEFNGATMSLKAWAEWSGIAYQTLQGRIRDNGLSIEQALMRPVDRGIAA
jgi:hypothetical protein